MNDAYDNDRNWILAWAVAQGVVLLLLRKTVDAIGQPDRFFVWIWPLYAWAILLPISLQLLAAHRHNLAFWKILAGFGAALAVMAGYDGWNVFTPALKDNIHYWAGSVWVLGLTLACGWFVLLPFAQYRLQAGRFGADYAFLFAASWRNALQLFSAAAFVGVFWGLLALWAALFDLLGIHFFRDLFTSQYFAYLATAAFFGLGLALYQVREAAILGLYRASLNILGWLLPLAAALAVGFLATLPFTGLAPLWKTGHATALMLGLQIFVLFLFNAAWQDGTDEPLPPRWLRRPLAGAVALLPVYAALCAYSLGLRVMQHGWSGDRVWAALLVFVVGFYGLGYARAALGREAWMAGVARVNVAAALTLVALLSATATPLLDPERIGVASQVNRLLSGQTQPADFDYHYLRFKAGRLGNEALQRLAALESHPQAGEIRPKAVSAQKMAHQYEHSGSSRNDWTPGEIVGQLRVYPEGAKVEESFLRFLAYKLNKGEYYSLGENQRPSPLLVLDLNGDGTAEYVLFRQNYGADVVWQDGEKGWAQAGTLVSRDGVWNIEDIKRELAAGKLRVLPPSWRDVEIGTRRYGLGR